MILDPGQLPSADVYRFMIGVIVPRPIAFVSTVGANGQHNVAPFSYFTPLGSQPPLLGISINLRRGTLKDTRRNIGETGDFVVNVVDDALLDRAVHASGEWPAEIDEFQLTGLTPVPSDQVRSPRVAESPVSLECRLHQVVELGTTHFVIGELVRAHVRDAVLTDGRVDPLKLRPVGRLGGDAYTLLGEVVHRARPRVAPPAG